MKSTNKILFSAMVTMVFSIIFTQVENENSNLENIKQHQDKKVGFVDFNTSFTETGTKPTKEQQESIIKEFQQKSEEQKKERLKKINETKELPTKLPITKEKRENLDLGNSWTTEDYKNDNQAKVKIDNAIKRKKIEKEIEDYIGTMEFMKEYSSSEDQEKNLESFNDTIQKINALKQSYKNVGGTWNIAWDSRLENVISGTLEQSYIVNVPQKIEFVEDFVTTKPTAIESQ